MADESVPPPRAPAAPLPVYAVRGTAAPAWTAFALTAAAGLGASLCTLDGWTGRGGGTLYLVCTLVVLARYHHGGKTSGIPVLLRPSRLPVGWVVYSLTLLYLGGGHPNPLDVLNAQPERAAVLAIAVIGASFAGVVGVAARREWSRRWFFLGWALAASVLTASWGLGLLWSSF